MITLYDYWMGRDKTYADEYTEEVMANAAILVGRVNDLLSASGFESIRGVASGWRPKRVNDYTSHAAKQSKHITGQAIDVKDPLRDLAYYCFRHQGVLGEHELWMEHPGWTPSWVHLQSVPPQSGRRVFIPANVPPLDPTFKG